MNIEKLTEIAEWLEAGAPHRKTPHGHVDGFDLTYWNNRNAACGTTCCIAGAVVEFNGLRPSNAGLEYFYFERGAEALGLPENCAAELFYAKGAASQMKIGSMEYRQTVTPAHAARCIRNLIATGCVDWIGTKEEA